MTNQGFYERNRALKIIVTETILLHLSSVTLIELLGISLIAGMGITTVGPGGILLTIALYSVTGLSPAAVAGTSIVTHLATGMAGTAVYLYSGQLRHPPTRRLALLLALAAIAGTPLGVFANGHISHRGFGILLGMFAAAIGGLVWHRQRAPRSESDEEHRTTNLTAAVLIGTAVPAAAAMFGLGGPMMTVPLLVAVHVPILPAVAAAQVQSLMIAVVGTLGYGAERVIDWPMALFVGIPEMAGVLIGWRIAHRVPTYRLRYALAAVLIALAPCLALRAG